MNQYGTQAAQNVRAEMNSLTNLLNMLEPNRAKELIDQMEEDFNRYLDIMFAIAMQEQASIEDHSVGRVGVPSRRTIAE